MTDSPVCPDGGIGRRTVFRWRRSQGRGGSSPLLGTICSHQNVPKHCRNGGILPFLTSSAESEVLFCSALFQRLWGPRLGAPGQKPPNRTKVRPPNEPQCAGNQRLPGCRQVVQEIRLAGAAASGEAERLQALVFQVPLWREGKEAAHRRVPRGQLVAGAPASRPGTAQGFGWHRSDAGAEAQEGQDQARC